MLPGRAEVGQQAGQHHRHSIIGTASSARHHRHGIIGTASSGLARDGEQCAGIGRGGSLPGQRPGRVGDPAAHGAGKHGPFGLLEDLSEGGGKLGLELSRRRVGGRPFRLDQR